MGGLVDLGHTMRVPRVKCNSWSYGIRREMSKKVRLVDVQILSIHFFVSFHPCTCVQWHQQH